MVVPQRMVALAPMDAPRLTSVVLYSLLRTTSLRGFTTLVKTIDGPQNTWSSSTTPVYRLTLFWILQPSPILTPDDTSTFCPMLQSRPMTLSFITCEKCQIFVPGPIRHGSSTKLLSWTK